MEGVVEGMVGGGRGMGVLDLLVVGGHGRERVRDVQ